MTGHWDTQHNLLGSGVLTWDAVERRTDRYGSVWLLPEGFNSFSEESPESLINQKSVRPYVKAYGDLIAVVTQNRNSTHIGDLFRKVFPTTPEVGEIIKLGTGELFSEPVTSGGIAVGLKPADGRNHDWLDIKALYRAHEQSINLFFHPLKPVRVQ